MVRNLKTLLYYSKGCGISGMRLLVRERGSLEIGFVCVVMSDTSQYCQKSTEALIAVII